MGTQAERMKEITARQLYQIDEIGDIVRKNVLSLSDKSKTITERLEEQERRLGELEKIITLQATCLKEYAQTLRSFAGIIEELEGRVSRLEEVNRHLARKNGQYKANIEQLSSCVNFAYERRKDGWLKRFVNWIW